MIHHINISIFVTVMPPAHDCLYLPYVLRQFLVTSSTDNHNFHGVGVSLDAEMYPIKQYVRDLFHKGFMSS